MRFITISILVASLANLTFGKLIDLTWGFNNETFYWMDVQPFVFTKQIASQNEGYWYASNEFCAGEHGGTHFDAPYHFNKNGWKVSEVPIERFFAKGVVVNVRDQANISVSDIRLRVENLEDWERRNGPFEYGSIILVNFGRSQYWESNRTKYVELDSNNKWNFPGVSEEAANWITKTGKFYGIGIDTPSIDPGTSTDFKAHQIFAANQMFHLENVNLMSNLPEKGFNLIIAPMKIVGGTGAPVRIFADVKL